MEPATKKLICAMTANCTSVVTHLDEKGFIYCATHGARRRQYCRCRKLKPKELKQLQEGMPVTKY